MAKAPPSSATPSALTHSFQHGVDDLVLLERIDENSIVANLQQRYNADRIYTYIGRVLVAVNPYKQMPIYTAREVKNYRGKYIFEEPPHVFAAAEDAYYSLISEGQNQSVIITGESGAGKTETSKHIMQYIAAVSGNSKEVQRVKEQILESNPVLEAFGNAKTVQNNNSSRFGKYFEIQFAVSGDPVGGRITNYLLEKSRVVSQAAQERGFHVFYYLVAGADAGERKDMDLPSQPAAFRYLNNSGCFTIGGVNDAAEYASLKRSMGLVGMPPDAQRTVFRLVAAVLHLGNIQFVTARDGTAQFDASTNSAANSAAKLLSVTREALEKALCNRTIQRESLCTPLNPEEAAATRDALAKAIYNSLFDWIVVTINKQIHNESAEFHIGVLDIYGFEIFEHNSFEQLCINFVNEKLHQLFVDQTLKREQEEYQQEKIKWENVNYTNNIKCVELIEAQKNGLFALLDEECLFPKGTDASYLEKLHRQCASNPHFKKLEQARSGPHLSKFGMVHYAGEVHYNVNGWLDKNRDQLFPDLRTLLQSSRDEFVARLFPAEQTAVVVAAGGGTAKRPPTCSYLYRNQLQSLMHALMSCTPHYIRCIRPNAEKRPNTFDAELVRRQVQYLGLLENVRVRRAGYAYRQTYEKFLARFKMCSAKTWPVWKGGAARDGCRAILDEAGIPAGAYEMGATKLFVREPRHLFVLEELRQVKIVDCVRIIQRAWRGVAGRTFYRKLIYTASELMWEKKERQRGSFLRAYKGDYLTPPLRHSKQWIALKAKYGDSRVYFADRVHKVAANNKLSQKLFVVTDAALYWIGAGGLTGMIGLGSEQISRRTLLRSVTALTMSTLADNFLVLRCANEPDWCLEAERKTEIASIVYSLLKEHSTQPSASAASAGESPPQRPSAPHAPIPVQFLDTLTVSLGKGKQKQITFSKDEKLTKPAYRTAKSDLHVTLASGLPKTAGESRKRAAAKPPSAPSRQINRSAQKRGAAARWRARATHDYVAQNARELSFRNGDVIQITERSVQGMWQGELNGKTGAVNPAFVQLM